jgi:hypothetical protein
MIGTDVDSSFEYTRDINSMEQFARGSSFGAGSHPIRWEAKALHQGARSVSALAPSSAAQWAQQ